MAATLSLVTVPCRAEDREQTAGLFAGAAVLLAGFTVGGTLLATSNGASGQNNAGWLTMESGFALAPLAAHGPSGEWGRGLAFAALPTAAVGGTATLFALEPGTVFHGTLPQQRWMWSMFGVALAAGAAGVVDSLFAGARARARGIVVTPAVASGNVGLVIQGAL
jgi:hypothetical protein